MTDIKVVQGVPVLPIHLVGTAVQGPKGENAYQLAVANGFVGTVVDWLNSLKGPATEFRVTATHIQWRQVGQTAWVNLIATSQLGIRLRTNAGNIEWSPVATTAWTVLLPLSDLTGPPGPTPILTIGTVVPGEPNEASASFTGTATSPALNLVLPRGRQGLQGIQGVVGPMVDVRAGTATSLPSGSDPTLEVVGTGTTRTLNLGVPQGLQGNQGDKGDQAWTPVLSVVADGERRVHHVDWANGSGIKPVTGYLGYSGVTSDIADALDIRGPQGSAGTGQGDMVAANNLSEVDPAAARANIQAAHEGGTANFTSVNYGTGGASVFSDNDGSLLVHTGSPAIGEAYFDFNKDGDLHAYGGSFFTERGEVWHPGNLNPASYIPKAGATDITGNLMLDARSSERDIGWRLQDGNVYWYGMGARVGMWDGINSASPLIWDTSTKELIFGIGADSISLSKRPYFGGATPWDSDNFVPANYLPKNNPAYTGVLTGPHIAVRDAPGTYRSIKFFSNAQQRWGLWADSSAESGTAAGSDFYFVGFDNNETQWNVFTVQRSTKIMNVYSPTVFSDAMQASQGMHVGLGNVAHIYKDAAALSIRYGSAYWSFKDGGEFNTYQLRSIDGMRIGDTNRNRHLYQFSDQVVRMTIGGSYWHFDEFAGTFRSSRIRITDRLIWGEEGLDGFYFDGATMWLENNRNFNLGAGLLTCGRLQTSSNGAGDNIKVGDDVWIGDGNISHGMRIRGQQDANQGYISFGNSGQTIGWDGTKYLIGGVQFSTSNVVTAADFTATSDARLKHNWADITEGWTRKLPEVKHGTFDWVDGSGSHFGVSAQELKEIFPAAVQEDADGMLSVSYGPAALMASIDLAKRVAKLEQLLEHIMGGQK